MLVNLNRVLKEAREKQTAVAALNVPTLEMIRSAIQTAEELELPVILQHAEGHNSLIPLEEIGPIMLDYARRSKVPVAVHLDHGKTFEVIVQAIRLGFTSVMVDASDQNFTDNLAITKEVVKMAHCADVSVEAELGHVFTSSLGGGEGREPDDEQIGDNEEGYTNPQLAKKFVEETAVDCLAVAFGTVHGIYLKKPKLDLARIDKIYQAINIPLVMHGGSGLSEADYRIAIKNGITKINYYTYANQAGGEAISALAAKQKDEVNFLEAYVEEAEHALKDNYRSVLKIFSGK